MQICANRFHPRTEHTITGSEIVALLAEVVADPSVSSADTDRMVTDCSQAEDDKLSPRIRIQARARCAAAWNARHGATP